MTNFTKLRFDELQEIRLGSTDALERVGLADDGDLSETKILSSLDEHLSNLCAELHAGLAEPADLEELTFQCGCLWGELLVQALNWQWGRVQFRNPNIQPPDQPRDLQPDQPPLEAVCVASADASLVIYPFQTIFLCCEGRLPVRIARSFEILSEPGRVPMLPPGGLENVMDHVH